MKNSKTLKNVIEVLTAFIYFCGFMTVAALVIHLLSRMGFLKTSFNLGACPLISMASSFSPNSRNPSGSCSSH